MNATHDLNGTLRRVARGELIGLPTQVVASTDPTLVGLQGLVADETLNTFLVERAQGRPARVAKATSTFDFRMPEGASVRIAGARLQFRPEDRIKRFR